MNLVATGNGSATKRGFRHAWPWCCRSLVMARGDKESLRPCALIPLHPWNRLPTGQAYGPRRCDAHRDALARAEPHSLGSLTVADGDKGEGKSAFTYDLAARVTAAKPMPLSDGEPVSGGAILLQAEDDLGATVKASVEAAGGDPGKIRVYTKAEPLCLDEPEDLAVVRQAAKEIDARLLVIDPFQRVLPQGHERREDHPERPPPASQLAAELRMAAILVRHITKSGAHALYRGLGGVAVANSARSAWWSATIRRPKTRTGTSWPSTGATCRGTGTYPWRIAPSGGETPSSSSGWERAGIRRTTLVAAARSPDDHSQLEEACRVLYSILATGGPMPATEVCQAARLGAGVGRHAEAGQERCSGCGPVDGPTGSRTMARPRRSCDGCGNCPMTKACCVRIGSGWQRNKPRTPGSPATTSRRRRRPDETEFFRCMSRERQRAEIAGRPASEPGAGAAATVSRDLSGISTAGGKPFRPRFE